MSTAMKKCEAKKRNTLKLLINKKNPKSEGKEIWQRKTPSYIGIQEPLYFSACRVSMSSTPEET